MKAPSSHTFTLLFFTTVLAVAHMPQRGRDIFDPLVSAVDSLLGISSTDSADTSSLIAAATTEVQITFTVTSPVTTTSIATSALQRTSTGGKLSTPTSATTERSSSKERPSNLSRSTSSPTSAISTSSSQSISITATPTPTNPSNSIQNVPSSTPAAPSTAVSTGNHISTAGIAVAIVFGVFISAGVAYLLLKFNSTINSKYNQWQESRRKVRTYRPGLDGDEENGHAMTKYGADDIGLSSRVLPWQSNFQHPAQESSNNLGTMTSPTYTKRLQHHSRPLSFQFFSHGNVEAEDTTVQRTATNELRRKPVSNINKPMAYGGRDYSDRAIGVAMPLQGERNKRLPLTPRL